MRRSQSGRRGSTALFGLIALVMIGGLVVLLGDFTSFASDSSTAKGTTSQVAKVSAAKTGLMLVHVMPSTASTSVSPYGPFQFTFNKPIQESTLSMLDVSVPGNWSLKTPYTAEFAPSTIPLPESTISIKTTASGGLLAKDGSTMNKPLNLSWTIESGSILRLQQILASLGYLPYKWSPLPSGTQRSPIEQLYDPLSGNFSLRYANTPATLESSFQPGVDNRMTQGAMVAFERKNGLPAYTSIRKQLWPALLNAQASGTQNPEGYSYASVSKARPETITIWHNGKTVLHTLVNTGLPQTPTPNGDFFVYLRYPTQTMRGTNINGSYYVDHGVKWVNYIDGSVAIHGFVRASYGFPQSLGCIELPVSQAAIAWKWLHYGSLVHIS